MAEITEVFSSRKAAEDDEAASRSAVALTMLRLPGWRRLVLGLSVMGAILILAATYSITTARELERARVAAGLEAGMLAEVLADEQKRLAPVAAALRVLLSQEAGGSDAEDDPGIGARLEGVLMTVGTGGEPQTVALVPPGGQPRFLRGGGILPAELVARTREAGASVVLGPAAPGEEAPRLWSAWVVDGAPETVIVVSLGGAALGHAWDAITGEVALVENTGRILLASTARAAGTPLGEWRSGRTRRDDLAASAAVEAGRDGGAVAEPLTVHVLYPRRIVRERVRDVISIEIMVMSLLATLAFFMDSQLSQRAYTDLSADADALKSLNARLSDEIAERRRVEAALAQASKLAALGQMSAAVAHELNQPLTAMRTYLATARHLSSKGDEAAAADNLGRIDALIGRMAALTRDLKAFARQDRAVSHAAELRAAVRHAAEILAERSQSAGAALSLSLGRGPTPVMAEAHRLEQIVLNLMQNAIDAVAGRNDARVEVTLKPRGEEVVLTIADNGPGLPAGDPSQVFAPFFTTKTAGEGLGLGLAISAAIAAELGGSIEAATRDEGGACFRLVLPRASA